MPKDETPSPSSKPGSAAEKPEPPATPQEKKNDPATVWTRRVLYLCVIFFVWYLVADRYTPYTSQARVRGFVLPIVPEVSGMISEVNVEINDRVEADEVLVKILPKDYELAVAEAEAALEQAGQDVGSSTADVASATAELSRAKAQLDLDLKQGERIVRAEKTDAVSKADADSARARIDRSQANLKKAEASLEQARQNLGAEGRDNPRIRTAQSALENAQIDLARTVIRAPGVGGVTNVKVDVGQYAQAGQPLMTFFSTGAVWIEAFMRENSLGRIKPGDSVDIVLDARPGRVFKGTVQSIGFGVQWGNSESGGKLPKISASKDWLRDPQRFPVVISFADDETMGLRREGGQADVIIYTNDNFLMKAVGRMWIRIISWFSYVG